MTPGTRYNPYKLFNGSFVPNWLLRRKDVTQGAKLLFARLSQYAGENGACFPSQSTLSEELGVSVSQIKRYAAELIQEKLIEVDYPTGEDRLNHKSPRYYFLWQDDCNVALRKGVDYELIKINQKKPEVAHAICLETPHASS